MIFPIFNRDILEVLTVFAISPGSRWLRKELKDKTKLNNINLDNALTVLLNTKLLKKEKRFLSLNLEKVHQLIELVSSDYKHLKRLPLNVYFAIVNIVYFLSKLKGLNVYLHGKYATLTFDENSPVELAIISNKITKEDKSALARLVKKTSAKHGVKIELEYLSRDFYKNKRDPKVKEILQHGVELI